MQNFSSVFPNLRNFIPEAPKIATMPVFPPINENSRFTVMCSLSRGTMPVFFYWSRNGQAIPKDSADVKILSADKFLSTLTIENVASKHAGNFTCSAKNAFGEDSQSTALIVRGWINLI